MERSSIDAGGAAAGGGPASRGTLSTPSERVHDAGPIPKPDTVARMIPRYSRPELAALWTDEARMSAWRDVEVAACEAMEGPTAAELEAIRAATFTVEAVNERERTTDHDVAAFVDVLSGRPGRPGAGSTTG